MRGHLARILIGVICAQFQCLIVNAAEFVDWTSVTPGGPGIGQILGTLDGTAVSAEISSGGDSSFNIGIVGAQFDNTVVDGTSPQYADSAIFTPSQALGDRIGFVATQIAAGSATLRVTFGTPVLSPVSHIANMDSTMLDFSSSVGTGRLMLVSGNGDGGDGLFVDTATSVVVDADPTTFLGIFPGDPIGTTGGRSAYGSVQALGVYSSLDIVLSTNPAAVGDDGFNLTIVADTLPSNPTDAINLLIGLVFELNLQQGISNSLDAKLDSVVNALDDANQNNDVAAVNSLNAFINAVQAQSGNHIPSDEANT